MFYEHIWTSKCQLYENLTPSWKHTLIFLAELSKTECLIILLRKMQTIEEVRWRPKKNLEIFNQMCVCVWETRCTASLHYNGRNIRLPDKCWKTYLKWRFIRKTIICKCSNMPEKWTLGQQIEYRGIYPPHILEKANS